MVPAIIMGEGKGVWAHEIIKDADYKQALQDKLNEEVAEYNKSGQVEELADIIEVIYALVGIYGVHLKDFEELRQRKLKARGGFEKRIMLVKVEDENEVDPFWDGLAADAGDDNGN